MAISQQTFPGVYTTIKDESFLTNVTARFRCGLVGVATKGPFDAVVQTPSLKEFRRNFGVSLSGYYLANAAAILADFTDGVFVVRVGRQYSRITADGSGGGAGAAAFQIFTPKAKLFDINDFIRVSEGGKITTVNAKISSYLPVGASQGDATGLQLVDTGSLAVPLADTYDSATIDKNPLSGAASNAEAFLFAYQYSSPLTSLGVGVGDKNSRTLLMNGNVLPLSISGISRSGTTATATTAVIHNLTPGNIVTITGANESNFNGTEVIVVDTPTAVTFTYTVADSGATSSSGTVTFTSLKAGDLVRVEQTGRVTTQEIRVKEIKADGSVIFEPASISEIGYLTLALQDSYTSATISKVVKVDGVPVTNRAVHLIAATAGTWANSDGSKTGLIVTVAPGSAPGSKKFLVYENSALIETIDNLSTDPNNANYYVTAINSRSSAIAIPTDDQGNPTGLIDQPVGTPDSGTFQHPANTANPWNVSIATIVNFAAFGDTDENWAIGYNGESPSVDDVIGTIDPNTDAATGLRLFENDENIEVHVIAIPGVTDLAVQQELARICRVINAIGYTDVPDTDVVQNPRQAVDWHNGQGLFSDRVRIDSANLELFFNWFQVVDPFTNDLIYVPPTLGALKTTARTFEREKPWFVAAGEQRGIVDDALAVRFPKISLDTKSAMYGNGNSVNPIILNRGRIMVFGDRTMQVAESKLSAAHSVILTNYIVNGMATIARRFVFDPNDTELLLELRLAFTKFLDSIKSERGVEDYSLVMDNTNNTAETRNLREVIVDLQFIPVDAVERIFINATVRESGAVLNNIG